MRKDIISQNLKRSAAIMAAAASAVTLAAFPAPGYAANAQTGRSGFVSVQDKKPQISTEQKVIANTDIGFCSGIDPEARKSEVYSETKDEYQIRIPAGKYRHDHIRVHYQNAFKIKDKYYDGEISVKFTDAKKPGLLAINKRDMSVSMASPSNTKVVQKEVTKHMVKVEKESSGSVYGDLAEDIATHTPKYQYLLGGRKLSTKKGEGIDCAHFVGYVYGKCGTDITSNHADQNVATLKDVLKKHIAASKDKEPIPLSSLKRGDILIFYRNGEPSHTAIYLGGGIIAHAADEDLGVTITNMNYNEKTGVAGYSGKTLQYVIRMPRTKGKIYSKDETKKKTAKEKVASPVRVRCEVRILDPDTGETVSPDNLSYSLSEDGKALTFSNGNRAGNMDSLTPEEKSGGKDPENILYYSGLNGGGHVEVNSANVLPGDMSYSLIFRTSKQISVSPVLSCQEPPFNA